MKFGTESTTQLTQNYARVKVQMTYIHTYIQKRSLIFNCVTPDSVLLTSLDN